ncbi:SRPBCC domain-containing protein [Flavobacterium sp. HTF]|uniref:SRPBCC domain-containing protein n=1 Tax=Flavobacterium sp. HTF TaxID=2170732 RepID=UPI000D5E424A|nr:SRPBCC domain-containing protein [Flavobacterium sp. HTF]PWB26501.1 polyketide cyclase [Flavobacterium sp. HTF]
MISVQTKINTSIEKVWELWTLPEHIVKWNTPGEDWQTSHAKNDLRIDGKFKFTMMSKDQSSGFDFEGIYTKVQKNQLIEYKLEDNRTARIHFEENGNVVILTEAFEPQKQDSESMQKEWCQAVIDNFKRYAENF